jgi:catechol 2,3-dioxygenase-like lactoylglutathione lyase family enzyme
VDVKFVASVSIVTADPAEGRRLYVEVFKLPLQSPDGGDYYFSENVEGTKHFGIWPLTEAAQACFGTTDWPSEHPVPQLSIEFEMADAAAVEAAASELRDHGETLLHPVRVEPWGQTIARILSSDGVIVGVSYAPWLHDESGDELKA